MNDKTERSKASSSSAQSSSTASMLSSLGVSAPAVESQAQQTQYPNYSYKAIEENQGFIRGEKDAPSTLPTGAYVQVYHHSPNEPVLNHLKNGWKFHISIDDRDPENLAAGWDIVKDILIERGVYNFKVVTPGKHMDELIADELNQQGKQITVYAFLQPHLDWQSIMQEITEKLAAANISPSQSPPDDRAVPGSHFVSYRNDKSWRGYGYNSHNLPDPYENMVIRTHIPQKPNLPLVAQAADVSPAVNVFSHAQAAHSQPATQVAELRKAVEAYASGKRSLLSLGAKAKEIRVLLQAASTIEDNAQFVRTVRAILNTDLAQESRGAKLMVQSLNKAISKIPESFSSSLLSSPVETLKNLGATHPLNAALRAVGMVDAKEGRFELTSEFTATNIARVMQRDPSLASHLEVMLCAEQAQRAQLQSSSSARPGGR